jgi:glycerate 2-kinase
LNLGNNPLGTMLFKNYHELISNGATSVLQQKRKDILEMCAAALDAVHPYRVVKNLFQDSQMVFPSETVDLSTFDHLYLVGFGKASVGMGQAVCDAVPIQKGVVITNDSSAKFTTDSVEIFFGGHPLPNEQSIKGADAIIELFSQCTENDCVIVVISGGGSALFCKPRVSLTDLQNTIDLVLRSGATINELNTIRKHLSFVKGGLLVQQTEAVVLTLIISDVVNDPLSSIASGPTVPDSSTFSDAVDILNNYDLWRKVSEQVRFVLDEGRKGRIPETLKERDPAFQKVYNFIVANNERACRGALQKAEDLGYEATLLTTALTGEAKHLSRYMVKRARQSLTQCTAAFISGGESTVTMRGNGLGGRNQEFVLGCVEDIAGSEMVIASFATDGADGNSSAAGAIADGYTLARAKKNHLLPADFLKENNSNAFFSQLGDAFLTGLTGTNVTDIQILLQ